MENSGTTASKKVLEELMEEQMRLHPEIYDNKNGGQ